MARGSGHACSTNHPECKKDKRAAKQDGKKDTERDRRRWGPAVGMGGNSQPTIGQKQIAETEHQSNRLNSLWRVGIHNLHHDASRSTSARALAAHRPPQDTTGATETEAEHRTERDVPSGSEKREESEAYDECLPQQFVDIFEGKNTSLDEWVMPGQAEKDHLERFVWQMTVTISCGAADRLQFRLSVPRSPALQHLIRDDVSWYTALPANTVPELIVVAIGLQPTLCPSRDERHIPPAICAFFLQQPPEGAVCCGTRAAEEFQTEAEFLPPFENNNPAAGDEEVAVMRYTDTWLGMTSTERLVCVSSWWIVCW